MAFNYDDVTFFFLQFVSVITCWLIIDIGVALFNFHFRPWIRIGIHVYMMKLPSCSTRYSINCMLEKELLIKQAALEFLPQKLR